MFKKIEYLYLALTSIFTYLFTYRLKNGEFIYSGDAFFRINNYETFINGFFIRKYENLGVHNGWQFITQFWDVIYYRLFYLVSSDYVFSQKLLLFITIFISFYIPYIGLRKIKEELNLPIGKFALIVISAWYTINPYTVSLWHGAVYTLGAALTYSLAPLIIGQLLKLLNHPYSNKNIIILSLYLGIASFTFWLFAPLALLLSLYLILQLLFNYRSINQFIKKVFLLILIYVPLISFMLFSILFEYFNSTGNNNSVFQPTFGNQQGGLWYQILMLFSWGIYTVWKPRAMYPFYKYYFTLPYIASTLSIYGLVLLGILNGIRKNATIFVTNILYRSNKLVFKLSLTSKQIICYIILLFSSLFLAKGPQPPFGELFLLLYNNVPFFSVFRTADIRFGFSVIICLTILLLLISKYIHSLILPISIIIIIVVQNQFFFTGQAVHGKEIPNEFYDHIISISSNTLQVANHINSNSGEFGYVLPIPAVEYGTYKIDEGYHLGQDLLPKIIKLPFLYLSQSNGIYSKTYNKLDVALKNNDIDVIVQYPIKYFLVRYDYTCESCSSITEDTLSKISALTFQNSQFKVYRNTYQPKLINGNNVSYSIINPVTYRVHIKNISTPQDIYFLSSFDKHWNIYLSSKYYSNVSIGYISKKPILKKSHNEYLGFANQWTISSEDIKKQFPSNSYTTNDDGSINVDLVIFYTPQSWFILSLMVSIGTLILMYFILRRKHINKPSNVRFLYQNMNRK